jgi:hypothetical protein
MKLKLCDSCKEDKVIWKNHEGLKFCKDCWYKQKLENKDLKPLKQRSDKRVKKDQEYLKLREKYLEQHPICEIKFSECTHVATDIHHTYSGANRETYYLIQSTWKSVCRNCHNRVHEFPKEARTLGYLK